MWDGPREGEMKGGWKIELPQWLVLAAMFLAAAVAWPNAPDRIPIHWNIDGQVDRYGGRFAGLLLMPLVAAGVYVLMLVLPRIDPGRANYGKFRGTYAAIRITLLLLFAVFDAAILAWTWNVRVNVAGVAPVSIGVVCVVLGALLGRIQPNWFVGIRTPWTLSSKVSWTRTHRAGGWVFSLVGVATIAATLLSPHASFWILIVGLVGGTIGLVAYSYVIWRHDPGKIPPAGTLPAD